MDLRERKPVRLTKAKDGGNRQLPKLQKRLVALIDDVGFCTITLQQDFCGLVQRCHGLERSKSWIEPTLMTRLDYYLGFEKPGMLNLDTRRNFWEAVASLHRVGDNGAFGFLPLLKILEFVLEYAKEIDAITNIDRRFYETAFECLYKSPTRKTFPYEITPILMDQCYPITRKSAQSVADRTDTTEVTIHVYPYSTIGVIDLHLSPPFAIVDFWLKIGKYGPRDDWTEDHKRRVQLVMEIMEFWQKNPRLEFLARKPPAPTPKGKDPNGGRDIVMDYATPSRPPRAVPTLPQPVLANDLGDQQTSDEPPRPSTASSRSDELADSTSQPAFSGNRQPTASTEITSRSEKSKGKQKAVDVSDSDGEGAGESRALSPVLEEDEHATPIGNDVDDVFVDSRATAILPSAPAKEQENDAGEPPIPTTSAPSVPEKKQRDNKRRAPDDDQPKAKRAKKNPPAGAPQAASAPPAHRTRSRTKAEGEDKTEEVKAKKGKTKKARRKNW
ncbi:hypothetical protein CPB85DRAFT_1307744 [Mucidula mucida]|nr:hypothetical protein CPB85DRAFT_1307744 [Mucidula mucida]